MSLTSAEQYMLELINRARLDPVGEAARNGIDLNYNLSPGQLHTGARGVLAPEVALEMTAIGHSQWMLANDIFSHTGVNNTTPAERATAAGYQGWGAGENISWRGNTGYLSLESTIGQQHADLFISASHRMNILYDSYREIGIAQEAGQFSAGGTTYNASMVTQNFSTKGDVAYVTGVAYTDANRDKFYSIGEGMAGTRLATSGDSAVSAAAGGYALRAQESGMITVTGTTGSRSFAVNLLMDGDNAKLDVVNGTTFYASESVTLLRGIHKAQLIGTAEIDATGNSAANQLWGNLAANDLFGRNGNDALYGAGGNDLLRGGAGADRLSGGAGRDKLFGDSGNDRLFGDGGNDILRGGSGRDALSGGAGADVLYGDGGNDRLTGGSGADRFVFSFGAGKDIITDFARNDVLRLDERLWETIPTSGAQVLADHARIVAGDVVIDLGAGHSVTLDGIGSLSGLSSQIQLF